MLRNVVSTIALITILAALLFTTLATSNSVETSSKPQNNSSETTNKTVNIALAVNEVMAVNEHRPNYVVVLGPELLLPSMAEAKACDAEIVLDFGFSEHRVSLFKDPIFHGPTKGDLYEECYLFRDVHGADANKLVADIMKMFAEQGYWGGIPSDLGYLTLVQSQENPNHIAFSFANEEKWIGPYAGVAGFDLANPEGLKMYLWSYQGFY